MISVIVKLSKEYALPVASNPREPTPAFTAQQVVAYRLAGNMRGMVNAAIREQGLHVLEEHLISVEPVNMNPYTLTRADICIEIQLQMVGDMDKAAAIRDHVASDVMRFLTINAPANTTVMVTVDFAPVTGVIQQGFLVTDSWPAAWR